MNITGTVYFKVLSRHSPGVTDVNHDKPQPGYHHHHHLHGLSHSTVCSGSKRRIF